MYIYLVKRARISFIMMLLTSLLVAFGQLYWLRKLYVYERTNLKQQIDVNYRTSFFELQRNRFLKDTLLFTTSNNSDGRLITSSKKPKKTYLKNFKNELWVKEQSDCANRATVLTKNIVRSGEKLFVPPELMEVFIRQAQKKDASSKISNDTTDGIRSLIKDGEKQVQEAEFNQPIVTLFKNNKTLNDSIPTIHIDSAFNKLLVTKLEYSLPYSIICKKWHRDSLPLMDKAIDTLDGFITSAMITGYNVPFSYQALFNDTRTFLFKQIQWQIIGSLALFVLLIATFGFMYHNLKKQQRLADMKNEFISNITHELKTPIATVHVAIEALRDFNAIQNPEKTIEYLDISKSELQRLQLLVDKVLKLSMFEKEAVYMQMERLDLVHLTMEVLQTMRLQFEMQNAVVQVETEGQYFNIQADRVNIISVIYNLLDNALKYSVEKPVITIKLISKSPHIYLHIADQGIGIPKAYKQKVFEKFFRVPNNNRHNRNGYGLGLSYVAHILLQHHGQITVTDNQPKGTIFTIQLPIA